MKVHIQKLGNRWAWMCPACMAGGWSPVWEVTLAVANEHLATEAERLGEFLAAWSAPLPDTRMHEADAVRPLPTAPDDF